MSDTIEDGRDSFLRRAWADAYRSLSAADRTAGLEPEDLERLAVSAYLIGRDEEFVRLLERAHHAHLEGGEHPRAARCAFWTGLSLLLRGETGPATGWLGRAQRLLEGRECAERGYLLLPAAEQELSEGDAESAWESASTALAIGERFGDADLTACARHLQGRALIARGRLGEGLALLDESMVAVIAGELSPIMTGLIYCSVIDTCRQRYALGRAREWTSALTQWCEAQPQLVAFTATCLVHRAEILRLSGAWADAVEEARRACDRERPPAAAFYQRAEVHRLRGEFDRAEEGYRNASRGGEDPQPGLCLLRLAQGRTETAEAAIRRAAAATADRLQRARLLPAFVEIMLAVDDVEAANAACGELEEIAASVDAGVLAAEAAQAKGAVALAAGDGETALRSLRRGCEGWQKMGVPYQAARSRVLIGLACRALGDEEGGRLELEAARAEFVRLGAAPDVARVDSLRRHARSEDRQGLTERELEVLRLVATGKTNRAIAGQLSLSEKTIERHLSNIFIKLGVGSRTAATAYAYEHHLI